MNFVKKEISFLVSSDPTVGAINRSPDGSKFEVQLEEALEVPKDAINCTLQVESSTIWFTTPNFIEGQNNKFYVFGDREDGAPAQNFVVEIPQGLYDLIGLNRALISGFEAAGAKITDNGESKPLITLSPDDNTQRVILRVNYPNVTVDFTQPDTPYEILGFPQDVIGPIPGAPVNLLAPDIAAFNQVNYFLIGSDLVQKGIRFNNRYNQIINQTLIDVAPGSQIVSTPFNPARTNCPELIGAKRTNIRFFLTDDKLRPVNTNGEYYTARIVIKYLIPMVMKIEGSSGNGSNGSFY